MVEAVSVEAVGGGAKFSERAAQGHAREAAEPARRTQFFSAGAWHKANVYTRDQLEARARASKAPAIIIEPHQTIVVEPGWQAELTREKSSGAARARRSSSARTPSAPMPIR